MRKKIDVNAWNRKDHYHFFKTFDEPFFGISANVDVTKAYHISKENNISFFIYYLFLTLKTVNKIEEFRYRIEDDELFCYDTIHASATIDKNDGSFGFSLIEFKEDFREFLLYTGKEIERVRKVEGLEFYEQKNLIYVTAIPWISFTSVSHARHFEFKDSIPRIAFGKLIKEQERIIMPTSVHAHHALMDGYHVGKFFELFQNLLNNNSL